jgi:hypothetical protein
VLGHCGLRDRELAMDGGADGSRGHLTACEKFENAATHRISKDVERVHYPKLKPPLI